MKKHILNTAIAALFTAVIAVCSQIAFPLPSEVNFTLQTLAVSLCGYALGIKWGLASLFTYILIGVIGLPVFSGFKGGPQILFGVGGGFIIGFIPLIILCGISLKQKNKPIKITLGIAGLIICHLLGIFWFSFIYNTNIIYSFLTVSLPFILKDILSVLAAFFISVKIIKK